jgi:hypothetical protein
MDIAAKSLGLHASKLEMAELISQHVQRPAWGTYVVNKYLRNPDVSKVFKIVSEAPQPLTIQDLLARLEGWSLTQSTLAIDRLITCSVLHAGIEPSTLDLVVGCSRITAEERLRVEGKLKRPKLVPLTSPKELGPSQSPMIDDLRALLIELCSEPAKLKMDGFTVTKDAERLLKSFQPVPDWFRDLVSWDRSTVFNILQETFGFTYLKRVGDSIKNQMMHPSMRAEQWLTKPVESQHLDVMGYFRNDHADLPFEAGESPIRMGHYEDQTDLKFLGLPTLAFFASDRQSHFSRKPSVEERLRLRNSVYQSLKSIRQDVFYPLKDLIVYLSFGSDNPLLLGRSPKEVDIIEGNELIPPYGIEPEYAARRLFTMFFLTRLIPLGCFRTAIDDAGIFHVARGPALDAYFGHATAGFIPQGKHVDSRVVIQPDFSVIVIGLDPTPQATLARFCEREYRGEHVGAVQFKLTRESVTKAIAHGSTTENILESLDRLAPSGYPANVRKEIENWGGWVKTIQMSDRTVLRCPDSNTADRIASSFQGPFERVSETMILLNLTKLKPSEIARLKQFGLLLHIEPALQSAPKKPKKQA